MCITAELLLLNCLNKWTHAFDLGLFTDVIYLDYAKAFDTVSHPKLLHKLENGYGIGRKMLAWIRTFLIGRTQRVKVGASLSRPCPVTSGIPQGTVSGPILFVLYINDLPDKIDPRVALNMFIDDTTLHLSCANTEMRVILQESVDEHADWSDQWQLTVQPPKTVCLTIGKAPHAAYSINGASLALVPSARHLGIIIDSGLDFKYHIAVFCRKALAGLHVLFKCFVSKDPSALLRAYVAFVRPVLEYASTVWNPSLNRRSTLGCLSSIDKLESVQRLFTRRLFWRCDLPASYSYLQRLHFLSLEPLQLRRLKFDLCMTYKICNGLVLLSDDASAFFERSDLRVRGNSCRFRLPHCRTDVRSNVFSQRVIPVWNVLPDQVVRSPSLSSFKQQLFLCHDLLLSFCTFDLNL